VDAWWVRELCTRAAMHATPCQLIITSDVLYMIFRCQNDHAKNRNKKKRLE
jgi:hypothetical protein